jgi:hypothetical protein
MWRVVGLCVMGWVLTASGSLAGPRELFEGFPLAPAQAGERRIERTELIDADSGAELRLTAKAGGALRASLVWSELDVSKVVQPNGDFHVRIAGRQDLVVLIRTGNRLRVTRGDQTAVMRIDQTDEEGLDRVQHVLAGSYAVRAFRAVTHRLGQDSRESAPGIALENLGALLGVVLGEPGAADRLAPKRTEGGRLARAACGLERSCYSAYEIEVTNAWGDFSQCVYDVRWYPGVQEVCAFTWVLRAESAWFQFIGCSSFPLRTE